MEKPSAGIKKLQGYGKHINFNTINLPKDDEEILKGKTFLAAAQWICKSIAKSPDNKSSEMMNPSTMNYMSVYLTFLLLRKWTIPSP